MLVPVGGASRHSVTGGAPFFDAQTRKIRVGANVGGSTQPRCGYGKVV